MPSKTLTKQCAINNNNNKNNNNRNDNNNNSNDSDQWAEPVPQHMLPTPSPTSKHTSHTFHTPNPQTDIKLCAASPTFIPTPNLHTQPTHRTHSNSSYFKTSNSFYFKNSPLNETMNETLNETDYTNCINDSNINISMNENPILYTHNKTKLILTPLKSIPLSPISKLTPPTETLSTLQLSPIELNSPKQIIENYEKTYLDRWQIICFIFE